MPDRQRHQEEVRTFLEQHFGAQDWRFTLPYGQGQEKYFAHGNGQVYFVKLGADIVRHQAMAALNLTPEVLAGACLSDGTSLIVQAYIEGRQPSRKDYREHLVQIATLIDRMHRSPEIQRILPPVSSELYREAGLETLRGIQRRWEGLRQRVPEVAGFVDQSLASLAHKCQSLPGGGLVASHNDICNANWRITADGRIYLIDLEAMSLDDPALDIGATLWWYYPPELWESFLEITGHARDEAFNFRMGVRMALHCLHIILPREGSFDRFDADDFAEALTDFRAILAGEQNPQGYRD